MKILKKLIIATAIPLLLISLIACQQDSDGGSSSSDTKEETIEDNTTYTLSYNITANIPANIVEAYKHYISTYDKKLNEYTIKVVRGQNGQNYKEEKGNEIQIPNTTIYYAKNVIYENGSFNTLPYTMNFCRYFNTNQDNSGTRYNFGDTITLNKDTTLYAIYEPTTNTKDDYFTTTTSYYDELNNEIASYSIPSEVKMSVGEIKKIWFVHDLEPSVATFSDDSTSNDYVSLVNRDTYVLVTALKAGSVIISVPDNYNSSTGDHETVTITITDSNPGSGEDQPGITGNGEWYCFKNAYYINTPTIENPKVEYSDVYCYYVNKTLKKAYCSTGSVYSPFATNIWSYNNAQSQATKVSADSLPSYVIQ